ncbi:hypothetical protein LCI18_002139 [Fusarium solani-melongenae]|uniref:Uncharacterized protein n=1 Tax=Fusarium solani subsp. cucurbitae TaxID=2747967 RepID=A0ACD3YQD4_FUSSC|nr:hypothetical protein LCI18_002139 [Fusarium solani-melongenae]
MPDYHWSTSAGSNTICVVIPVQLLAENTSSVSPPLASTQNRAPKEQTASHTTAYIRCRATQRAYIDYRMGTSREDLEDVFGAFDSPSSSDGSTNHNTSPQTQGAVTIFHDLFIEPDPNFAEPSRWKNLTLHDLAQQARCRPDDAGRIRATARVRIPKCDQFNDFCGQYSCPYRKRNPRMFNVGDFRQCAVGPFNNLAEVRQHILEHHLFKDFTEQCRVCNLWFHGKEALRQHLRAQTCLHSLPAVVDVYDRGISDNTADNFRSRRARGVTDSWGRIWGRLFPVDRVVKSPEFFPPSIDEPKATHPTKVYSEDPSKCLPTGGGQSSSAQQGPSENPVHLAAKYNTEVPSMKSVLQQVGRARLRIEILTLVSQHQEQGRNDEESPSESTSETDCGESEEYDAQESHGSPEAAPTTSATDSANHSNTSASAIRQAIPLRGSRTREDDDDGDDGDRRQAKRIRKRVQNGKPPRGRFACPYQVHEPWRDCFKPSQRNPQGGCDSISRLKDHMTRKHMLSYRCQRCWKQFNARHRAQEHQQSGCVQNEFPRYEQFMSLEQEMEVERCGGMTAEDTWWALFQFLIPGMDQEDISQLKDRYFPYYVQVDMSLTIPSLTLSNVSFENVPTQPPTQASTVGDGPTQSLRVSPPDTVFGLDGTGLVSQSLSVPIYGTAVSQAPSISSREGSGLESTALSTLQQSYESDSTTPSDRINIMKTSREEVRAAGTLLEEVLAIENLEGEMYERLSRAAEILIGVTGRLR